MSFLFLIIAIIFNIPANFCFKYSSLAADKKQLSIIYFIFGLLLGGINTLFFTKSLKEIELNIAYPVFSAGCIILITILSLFLFNESLTLQKAAGIIIICVGIGLITT